MAEFDIMHEEKGKEALIAVDNRRGMRIELSSRGASLRRCQRNGRDLTLGLADPQAGKAGALAMGATIGRFCSRIAAGRFNLDGKVHKLECNNGPNHLHGGRQGFQVALWQAQPVETVLESNDRGAVPAAGACFSLLSPAGDQGYPGSLAVRVAILLSADNQLAFAYRAWTDAPTIVNLSNHSYWNLSGVPGSTVHDHWLRLSAKGWLDVDAFSVPNGRLKSMQYAAWDFREDRPLSLVLSDPANRTLAGFTRGIDHCFMLDPQPLEMVFGLPGLDWGMPPGLKPDASASGEPNRLRYAGRLSAPGGASMEFFTSLPGLNVYTGNFLDGHYGRDGVRLPLHGGICLETMHFPDAPNQAAVYRSLGKRFGWSEAAMGHWDAVLQPGHLMQEMTVHRFA